MIFQEVSNYIRESNAIEGIYDPLEIKTSLNAWEYLSDIETLTDKNLLEVHRLILEHIDPEIAGKFRKCNVRVGDRICPTWQSVKGSVTGILRYVPYTPFQALDWHIRFEKIHPFQDGNGRTGRIIYWWHCLKTGGYPILFQAERRKEYYTLFSEEKEPSHGEK